MYVANELKSIFTLYISKYDILITVNNRALMCTL